VKNIDGRVKTLNALGTNKKFALSLKDLKGRRLVAGLPTRRSVFSPSPVHMGLLLDRMLLKEIFLRVLQFSLTGITPPMLHTHSFVTDATSS
jgi:hypothetical protein